MARTSTDEEQIEMLKTFWKEYGRYILIAVIVGLLIGYGWQYWKKRQMTRTLQASHLYYQIITPSDQDRLSQSQLAIAKQVVSHYPQTPYASLASFMFAKQQIGVQKYNQALPYLSWVITHSHVDSFKQLAKIRKARIEINLHKSRQALSTLHGVDDIGFVPMIEMVRAHAYLQLGDKVKAKALYAKAKAGYQALGIVDPTLLWQ